jgi:hypothetical protein
MHDDALLHVTLIDPHILENEEKFRSYVQKVNDITATFRHQVITAALNVSEVALLNFDRERWLVKKRGKRQVLGATWGGGFRCLKSSKRQLKKSTDWMLRIWLK